VTIPVTQMPSGTRVPTVIKAGPARPRSWPARQLDTQARSVPGPRTGRRIFVGRQEELDVLDALMAAAVDGRPQLVAIEGEAGMGKSALISEFLERHQAVSVLSAGGEESEQALPFGLVRQLAGAAASGLLARCPVLAAGPATDADPLLVGAELHALLSAMPGASSLAVIIEDLQWADLPSAHALLFACRRLTRGQILVVVSGRPLGLRRLGPGWARFLQAERLCRRLTLTGLSRAELGKLAVAVGRSAPQGRALRQVADYSNGNPQLARALLTEVPDEALADPPGEICVPGSLSAMILPRLAALPADARDLVIAAAVLGECCALSDAALLAGVPLADDALDVAAEAGFLTAEQPQDDRVPPGAHLRQARYPHPLSAGRPARAAGRRPREVLTRAMPGVRVNAQQDGMARGRRGLQPGGHLRPAQVSR
jgi:hypothetical protein